ncbi:MAG: methyltransferase [Devosiaceae bacterium]|nr:methyltransferase [Devosiaceae bacterium]
MSIDHKTSFVKHSLTSLDEFLDGKLLIEQPQKGFRSGIDAILLGSSVKSASVKQVPQELLELGCGTGVAALCALVHNDQLSATLVDNNRQMLELANNNIARNNMQNRAKTIGLDIVDFATFPQEANIKPNSFSIIIANPPYFDSEKGTAAKGEGRKNARHMQKGDLDKWVKFATTYAKAKGEVIFIFRAEGLGDLLKSFEKRFGNIKILPIISRDGQDASRVLVGGIKGSRAKLQLKSPLILHAKEGNNYLPEIEKIFRAQQQLHW